MKNTTTLVIVDVQPGFETAKHAVAGVLHQIKLAKRRKAGIIVVEYDIGEYGASLPEVRKEIGSYRNVVYTEKCNDDGSMEIIDAGETARFNLRKIRFCGVNALYCVHDSIFGFLRMQKESKVEVAFDACFCDSAIGKKNFRKVKEMWKRIYEQNEGNLKIID